MRASGRARGREKVGGRDGEGDGWMEKSGGREEETMDKLCKGGRRMEEGGREGVKELFSFPCSRAQEAKWVSSPLSSQAGSSGVWGRCTLGSASPTASISLLRAARAYVRSNAHPVRNLSPSRPLTHSPPHLPNQMSVLLTDA